jgi:hypothetical protein
VQLQKLGEVSDWIEPYRVFRTKKLDALEQMLAKKHKKNSKQIKRTKK